MMMLSPYRPEGAPATGFGAEIFFNREIYASRRGVPLKMRNIVGILLNFRGSAGSTLAAIPSLQPRRWRDSIQYPISSIQYPTLRQAQGKP